MKSLHRPDLYSWAVFDPERNVDFNGVAWIRPDGNVLIDPVSLSDHDLAHLKSLGGAAWIVITNSDHIRATQEIAQWSGATIAAPVGEKTTFPLTDLGVTDPEQIHWLDDGDEVVPGLQAIALHGSKTPGELAFVLEDTTLITGDLVRAHQAGRLMILPDAKLQNRGDAVASVHKLAKLPTIEAVLVGDGWSVFRNGSDRLQELATSL
jgi:hypothetical protein